MYGNVYVSALFSQIIPPSPSPTEYKSLFFTSVSGNINLHGPDGDQYGGPLKTLNKTTLKNK